MLTPYNVSPYSRLKVWWKCKKCNYGWKERISAVANGSKCPSCSGRWATKNNCLETLYPNLAAQLYSERNHGLKPSDIVANNKIRRKYYWKCDKCFHLWRASIYHRTKVDLSTCPNCSGTKNNTHGIFNKSLVTKKGYTYNANASIFNFSLVLCRQWHPDKNGDLTPYATSCSCEEKVWWLCEKCNHEWEEKVSIRVNGSVCPNCFGKPKIPEKFA